jgi:hypothetical protein
MTEHPLDQRTNRFAYPLDLQKSRANRMTDAAHSLAGTFGYPRERSF